MESRGTVYRIGRFSGVQANPSGTTTTFVTTLQHNKLTTSTKTLCTHTFNNAYIVLMDGDFDWHEGRTRPPSVIPDHGVREFLEQKTVHLFATQLQSRLRALEQTRETPKFLRRNSYQLYLEGHFALLDPRDLERTTLSPTPPSSDDWISPDYTPEQVSDIQHYEVNPVAAAYPRPRTFQEGGIEKKRQRCQDKRSRRISKTKKHHMVRRSKAKEEAIFYELDWVGRNMVTVCQSTRESAEDGIKRAGSKMAKQESWSPIPVP
ncbi:uncharacterized protein Z518_06143 [Rhinocladiella mackenziei CBS 650.93]|uniref:Uncharacterized protein n=1 Tax=Rhinocladiella mackenziei CBS 650.93 TaxID=1442369 RepID=A0A0D2IQ10_9EURO|nr:uncharacterized protein Z518_06143 [Rhinocladiella mackenziei CBS 650.93]KIX05271.1 hypothetical protein Z518_06143 [Rhinocladiella mackenziei CBS 650.93]